MQQGKDDFGTDLNTVSSLQFLIGVIISSSSGLFFDLLKFALEDY